MAEFRNRGAPSLFPLAPIGMGSAAVESLTSFLARLAVAHGVSVGQLIRFLYDTRPACSEASVPGAGTSGDHIAHLSDLVRPNRASRFIRQRLEQTTGSRSLAALTFSPLAGGLDRCQGAFSTRTRWCPACFRESEVAGGPAYYKLVWQIRDITLCPVHGVALLDQCPSCAAHQDTRGHRRELSLCQSCGGSLSVCADKEPMLEWAQSESADICELLDQYLQLPEQGIGAEMIRSGLDRFFDGYWESEREQELYELFGGRDRWLGIVCGSAPLTLQSLRRTAYRLGVSLYDLMCGELAQPPLSLEEVPQRSRPAFMKVRRRERHDREAVLRRVRAVIEGAEHPLPLVEVAREACVSTGYLRYRFPVLTRQILLAHRRFDVERAQRSRQEAMRAILAYRAEIGRPDGAVGVKKIVNVLHRRHGFSKYMLRRAFDDLQAR